MADYQDKIVEVNVELPVTNQGIQADTGFNGLVVKSTPSVTLAGLGTEPSPLSATVQISRKTGNQAQTLTADGEAGIFVPSPTAKVSAKAGNIITNTTAEEAAAAGNPALEGVYASPIQDRATSPTKTVSIKAVSSDTTKSTIDVVVDSANLLNALKVTADKGLSVAVSPVADNTLIIRSDNTLYVPSSATKISQEAGNKIEVKSDGIYVTTVKGDKGDTGATGPQGPVGPKGEDGKNGVDGAKGDTGPAGPQGPKGDTGLGINVIAKLDTVGELPDVNSYDEGDTFVIDGHFWTKVIDGGTGVWADLGSFIGPEGLSAYEVAEDAGFVGTVDEWLDSLKGADGIGLRILGSFTNTSDLPMEGNTNGDAYIVQSQMWVWDGAQWSPVGQVGPAGKSTYQIWLDNGNTGSQLDFLAAQKGAKGDKGDQGIQGPQGPAGENGTDGSNATALNVLGLKATSGDLPPTGNTLGDAWLVGTSGSNVVYMWDGTTWQNLGALQGPQGIQGPKGDKGDQGDTGVQGLPGTNGKDNYALAVQNGFTGSLTEYLASLKGAKGDTGPQGPRGLTGDKGDKGDTGTGLTIKGTVAAEGDLPTNGIEGDSYLIGENLYVRISGAWRNVGPVKGPKGDQGIQGVQGPVGPAGERGNQGVKGEVGPAGPTGPAGAKGDQGIQGPAGAKGDQGIQGPKGDKGDTGAALTPKGTKPTQADLPATGNVAGDMWSVNGIGFTWNGTAWVNIGSIQGPKGDQGLPGVDGAVGATGPQGPIGPKGDTGEQGPQGEKGEMGAGVKILGRVANEAALPPTGTLGEGYLIDLNFWVWDGTQYTNVGPIQGPKGDQGLRGLTGAKGDTGATGPKGDKGDRGNYWILLERNPTAADGVLGDLALNTLDQTVWQKTSTTAWAQQPGHLGGGNVYEAPTDGQNYVRNTNGWKVLPVDEAPNDAKNYVRKSKAWAEMPAPTVIEAPVDTNQYVRAGGAWKSFDRYDLAVVSSTGAVVASSGNVFVLNGTQPATLVLSGFKAARPQTLVVVLNGTGGTIAWPTNVLWNNGVAPTLLPTRTVLTFFWDGTNITGFTGGA